MCLCHNLKINQKNLYKIFFLHMLKNVSIRLMGLLTDTKNPCPSKHVWETTVAAKLTKNVKEQNPLDVKGSF